MKLIYELEMKYNDNNELIINGNVKCVDGKKIEILNFQENKDIIEELQEDMNLIYNAAECLVCKNVIVSKNTHDFVMCPCKDLYIDGGLSYNRWGSSNGCILKLIYSDEISE